MGFLLHMHGASSSAPTWLAWATALGTIGAALFAGWAALASTASVRRSGDLVDIERGRDEARVQADRIAQAKRVMVDLISEPLLDDAGELVGFNFRLLVANANPTPIFKVRIRVVGGGATWGPLPIGGMKPGQEAELYARVYTSEATGDLDAAIRFTDTNDLSWVATARGKVALDDAGLDLWIEEGAEHARRQRDSFERGRLDGVSLPDFDGWRESVEDADRLGE